ncbi:MAG: hypothetical protein K2G77_09600 [Muribaculaceae bacterium]|nr:hypothetical protein [Muribaculaceae bacterium]
MKKLLLLTGISAISLAALAEVQEPKLIDDAIICSISPDGTYAVSQGLGKLRILNLITGEEYTKYGESENGEYYAGDGNCVSNNGIVVASTPDNPYPLYWKDGKWHNLPVPSSAMISNFAQAINADGSRMCGTLRIAGMGNKDDMLMVAPCVWNAEGDGYSMPVMLPHPEFDYSGSVPQYITAIDISADGKVVVGQIRDANGILNYPIIYRENENGEWSYEIPHEELINPDKLEAAPFPGDGPIIPQFESYMTSEEIAAYDEAFQEYVDSGCQIPCPEYWDFMTLEEIEAYNNAVDEYNEKAIAYNEKYVAWATYIFSVANSSPDYAFNQVRISPDGKTIGCTVQIVGEFDPMTGYPTVENTVWLMDLTSDKITKYNKDGDININYVANNGIGIGNTSSGAASNSYILQDGEAKDIVEWMNTQVPAYASWINDNMIFTYEDEVYNEANGNTETIYTEGVLTGRATATPDMSVISLSIQNIWDYMDDGIAYIFDIKGGNGVETVAPSTEEQTIYDLSGRKLNNAAAPGIYIINGKKKVVR